MEFYQLQWESAKHKLALAETLQSFVLHLLSFPSGFLNCILMNLTVL